MRKARMSGMYSFSSRARLRGEVMRKRVRSGRCGWKLVVGEAEKRDLRLKSAGKRDEARQGVDLDRRHFPSFNVAP